MCGLSFSGKTTAARRLAEGRQAELISLDEINEKRGLGFGGDGLISREEWRRTHEIALARLENLLETQVDIVLDDTNCFRFLRDHYRDAAARHGYKTVVVLMAVPIEEIESRIRQNTEFPKRHGIQEHVFRMLLDHFEWPGEDEETIRIQSADSLGCYITHV
jgi:predicted kinase